MVSKGKSKNKYLVYTHSNPKTGEVVYVGRGINDRPWLYYRRSEEHKQWIDESGYDLDQIVTIVHRGLSVEESKNFEKQLTELYKPRFDRWPLAGKRAFTKETFQRAKELREEGLTFQKIGDILGVSRMTVWNAIKRSPKAYV